MFNPTEAVVIPSVPYSIVDIVGEIDHRSPRSPYDMEIILRARGHYRGVVKISIVNFTGTRDLTVATRKGCRHPFPEYLQYVDNQRSTDT